MVKMRQSRLQACLQNACSSCQARAELRTCAGTGAENAALDELRVTAAPRQRGCARRTLARCGMSTRQEHSEED